MREVECHSNFDSKTEDLFDEIRNKSFFRIIHANATT